MAGFLVDRGPITATDRLRDVPKAKWHDLMIARRAFLSTHLSYDCRCLIEFVDDAKLMFKPLGFATPEVMIREGYGLEPGEIEIAVEWLRLNPPAEPLSMATAIELGKQGAPKGNKNAAKTKENKPCDARFVYGTVPYWRARLARDHQEILEAFERGEYDSIRAAAIAAGILKPPTPLAALRRAWKKASESERATFRESVCE